MTRYAGRNTITALRFASEGGSCPGFADPWIYNTNITYYYFSCYLSCHINIHIVCFCLTVQRNEHKNAIRPILAKARKVLQPLRNRACNCVKWRKVRRGEGVTKADALMRSESSVEKTIIFYTKILWLERKRIYLQSQTPRRGGRVVDYGSLENC